MNEQLIRPVFLNTTVIFLFILPMVTMRTYSEEKRSGTIELLLTAPLTDFQIIAGKFLGAMGLYAAMLAVTHSARRRCCSGWAIRNGSRLSSPILVCC